MNNLIEDVLFYLPDWTVQKSTQDNRADYIKPFLENEDIGEVKVAKRIKPREVEIMFRHAQDKLTVYTGNYHLPEHPIMYRACCCYCAGLLFNKYTLSDQTQGNALLNEAKEMAKPFIRVRMYGLSGRHNKSHHTICPQRHPRTTGRVVVKVYEPLRRVSGYVYEEE